MESYFSVTGFSSVMLVNVVFRVSHSVTLPRANVDMPCLLSVTFSVNPFFLCYSSVTLPLCN
jgi:predicted membrane GTPase involved in stress response